MGIAKPPSILIVDDYPAMLRLLHRFLKDFGIPDIDQTTDGAAALDRMRTRAYGLVISDLNMKPMSGLELLIEIRNDLDLKDIPFIMLTAIGESEQVLAAKQAGVTDYLLKPFTGSALLGKVERIFGSAS